MTEAGLYTPATQTEPSEAEQRAEALRQAREAITAEEWKLAEDEALQLFNQRMDANAAKTADAREAEKLSAQIETLSAEIAQLAKQPTLNAEALKEKRAQHETLFNQLVALGAIQDKSKRKPNYGYIMTPTGLQAIES